MSEDVRERLKGFIQNELMSGRGDGTIGDEDELLASGIIDSLGAFSIVFFIEEAFGVDVPAGDVTVENFSTITRIADYISGRRG